MKTIKIFTEYITLNINEFINTFIVGARTSLRRVITPSLAVALLAVALLASCGKGDDISDEPEPETPDVPATPVAYTFVVSADSLHAYAKGGADTITVRSFADSLATPFTLSDKPEWVSATALNDSVFEITIEANPVKAPREGLLTFTQTASDTAVYVKIAQNELHTKYVWKKGSIKLPEDLSSSSYSYSSISYVDNDSINAFVVIDRKYLYSTADGGRNWTQVNSAMDIRTLSSLQTNIPIIVSWLHFTSPTEGVYVCVDSDVKSYMYKTTDGGTTWTEIVKGVKTRGYVVPSDPALPEYFTDEYVNGTRMTTMAVSRDNKWDSPLILNWDSRYGNKANTGCITSDYTFIGTWDGRVCRAKTEDVLNSGGDLTGLVMEESYIGYEGESSSRGFQYIQEAGGTLYMRSKLIDQTLYNSQLGYVLKSTDRGATWSSFPLNDNLPEAWKDLPQSTSSILYFDNIIALDSECILAFLHARDKSTNTYHYVVCLISLKEGKIIREMPLTGAINTFAGGNFVSAYNNSNILIYGADYSGVNASSLIPVILYLDEDIIDEEAANETIEN